MADCECELLYPPAAILVPTSELRLSLSPTAPRKDARPRKKNCCDLQKRWHRIKPRMEWLAAQNVVFCNIVFLAAMCNDSINVYCAAVMWAFDSWLNLLGLCSHKKLYMTSTSLCRFQTVVLVLLRVYHVCNRPGTAELYHRFPEFKHQPKWG